MSEDLKSARHWARAMIERALCPGARAVDATMGNGHDTLWLCGLVGETGHVYAFDVQPTAVENTRARLEEHGCAARATLICQGHQHMAQYVDAPVDAMVFNLGWLPGGEKTVTTLCDTTLHAVAAGAELLKPGGLMTICIYPGHPEGARERDALLGWARELNPREYDVLLKAYLNQPNQPPMMLAVRRRI